MDQTRVLSDRLDSTRYFMGPQVSILRDDNRLVTWAAIVEALGNLGKPATPSLQAVRDATASLAPPRLDRKVIAEGPIWRYHLTLDKYTGEVTTTWITRSADRWNIWFDAKVLQTQAQEPDFPFYAFSQPPIGHVVTKAPPFSLLSYKCRKTGRLFMRNCRTGRPAPRPNSRSGTWWAGSASQSSARRWSRGQTCSGREDRPRALDLD